MPYDTSDSRGVQGGGIVVPEYTRWTNTKCLPSTARARSHPLPGDKPIGWRTARADTSAGPSGDWTGGGHGYTRNTSRGSTRKRSCGLMELEGRAPLPRGSGGKGTGGVGRAERAYRHWSCFAVGAADSPRPRTLHNARAALPTTRMNTKGGQREGSAEEKAGVA